MFEFISNIIDNLGINISRLVNSGKGILGKDIKDIRKSIDEYDTKRIFEKILSSPNIEFNSHFNPLYSNMLTGLEIQNFTFESAYEPFEPFKIYYKMYPELKKVKGIHIKNISKKNRKVIIFLHNLFDRNFDFYKFFLFPKIVKSFAYDVYAPELAHHMNRQIKNSPFSGSYFLSGNPIITIEAIRQSVSELTQMINYLKEIYEEISIIGINLGGHIALYSTIIDDSCNKYMLVQTGANLNEYIHNIRLSNFFIKNSRNFGITDVSDFASLYRSLNFLNYHPLVNYKKIVLIAGKFDNIIPFESVKKLEKIFDGAKTIYYDGGNFSIYLLYNAIMEEMFLNLPERRKN